MTTKLFLRSGSVGVQDLWSNGAVWNKLDGTTHAYAIAGGLATSNTTGIPSFIATTVAGPTSGVEFASSSVPQVWSSPPISADTTISGTITLNAWASESGMNANATIGFRIFRMNGQTRALTEISKSTKGTELGTSIAVNNWTATPTSTNFIRGDRIVVSPYIDDATAVTMGAGFTCTMDIQGTAGADGDTWVQFNETFSFESAPAGTTLYFRRITSDVTVSGTDCYEIWTAIGSTPSIEARFTAINGPVSPQQMLDNPGTNPIEWYSRQLQAVTLAGPVRIDHFSADLATSSGSHASMVCEIAICNSDGSSPTVWGISGARTLDSAGPNQYWIEGPSTAISQGQRFRIRMYAEDGTPSGPGQAVAVSGLMVASGSYVNFPYDSANGGGGNPDLIFPVTLTEFIPTSNPAYMTPYPQILPQ